MSSILFRGDDVSYDDGQTWEPLHAPPAPLQGEDFSAASNDPLTNTMENGKRNIAAVFHDE